MTYPRIFQTPGVADFAGAVDDERQRQLLKWGPQPLPDGTGLPEQVESAEYVRQMCEDAFADGEGTHAFVMIEEAYEVLAESDPVKLKMELIQLAAVCAKWIADIDARPSGQTDDQVQS